MTPEQRYRAMRSNRGRTGPERALASALWQHGFRYLTADGYRKRYGKSLTGQPDLIFSRRRTVVFVDGCFWHGCPECRKTPPASDEFWRNKIQKNVERDKRVTAQLEAAGWVVIRVPEHDVRTKSLVEQTAESVAARLRSYSAGKVSAVGKKPESGEAVRQFLFARRPSRNARRSSCPGPRALSTLMRCRR